MRSIFLVRMLMPLLLHLQYHYNLTIILLYKQLQGFNVVSEVNIFSTDANAFAPSSPIQLSSNNNIEIEIITKIQCGE